MKKNITRYLYIAVLIWAFSTSMSATNYYSDPTNAGNMSNLGTFNNPWANLQAVFNANKSFLSGDTIFLRTGNHGTVLIKGSNTNFVVITAQSGHSPVINRIKISESETKKADFWKLENLVIVSQAENAYLRNYLIDIYPFASNITISSCTIQSALNTDNWSRDDLRNKLNNGINTAAKLNANYLIENNLISNVSFGLSISSSNTIVKGNTVKNFTYDGSRVNGSDILFENNKILDFIKVINYAENHADLFQSFVSTGVGQTNLQNNIIRGNLFISNTDTTRNFRGSIQGMGCFDGPYTNWIVENNIVITDNYHGITLLGAQNCKIVNNTVIDPYKYTPYNEFDNNTTTTGPTWIKIGEKTGGAISAGNIVNNNLVANQIIIASGTMGTQSNNIIIGAQSNYEKFFLSANDFSLPGNFNLQLKLGSPAINAGTEVNAANIDFDNNSRPQDLKIDVGAYEFIPKANGIKNPTFAPDLAVYFNPLGNEIFIQSSKNFEPGNIVQIYNSNGQLVYKHKINSTTNSCNINNVSFLSKGMYILNIMAENNISEVFKIIKN